MCTGWLIQTAGVNILIQIMVFFWVSTLYNKFFAGIIFAISPCILILSSLNYYPMNAQLNIPRRMLKFYIKINIKSFAEVTNY
jgi:hypothetical protein